MRVARMVRITCLLCLAPLTVSGGAHGRGSGSSTETKRCVVRHLKIGGERRGACLLFDWSGRSYKTANGLPVPYSHVTAIWSFRCPSTLSNPYFSIGLTIPWGNNYLNDVIVDVRARASGSGTIRISLERVRDRSINWLIVAGRLQPHFSKCRWRVIATGDSVNAPDRSPVLVR